MLAELAAANAAFGVIKSFISNGKDLASCGKQISDFVFAKEQIEKKAKKQKAKGVRANDLEEFMALEKIKQQEEELKQIMIYVGRPGLWQDWQKFQAKARVARREAEQERIRKRKHHFEVAVITFLLIVVACIFAALALLVLHHQGRL